MDALKDLFGLENKLVVITGAASGMGKAATELLLKLGAEVYAVDLNPIDLPVKKAFQADLSDKAAIEKIVGQIPDNIEGFFSCQGMAAWPGKELLVQKVNFIGQKYMVELLLPKIVDNGSVTLISSVGGFGWQACPTECKAVAESKSFEEAAAWCEAHPEVIKDSYTFSKKCMLYFVKSKVFAPEFIKRRIRINAICPGYTLTGLSHDFNVTSSPTGKAEDGEVLVEKMFLGEWNGRPAAPEEMGYPLVLLGSKIFSYMSGQTVYVDYGLTSTWEIAALGQ